MGFIVDIQLRYSILKLIEDEPLSDTHLNSIFERNYMEKDKRSPSNITIFYKIIKKVVKRRLEKIPISELHNKIITTKDLLNEGQGSIQICDPPTDAQSKIVKSLVKVVLHQQNKQFESCGTEEGQDNLILSLFVKKIFCEYFEEVSHETMLEDDDSDLQDRILFITKENENTKSYTIDNLTKYFKEPAIYPFYCMEDIFYDENEPLLEEFDKIDLDQENSSDIMEGETIYGIKYYKQVLKLLPISEHTISYTNITILPSTKFEGMWESLQFDDNIKQRMYNYATISLKISSYTSQHGSQHNMINNCNNKLLLVHGPPGTGKTTLCKALCSKLAIRGEVRENESLNKYGNGILLEISCSNIFSRWFGESSKNLTLIFKDIENLLIINQLQGNFVCLLIDEVEAIAYSRSNLLNKNETTDSVRVVSTLLTLLDSLKKYENLLILATSNIIDSLDEAFIDRADGIFFIDNPSKFGIIAILRSSINELISLKILETQETEDIFTNVPYKKILEIIAEQCFVCTPMVTICKFNINKLLTIINIRIHK